MQFTKTTIIITTAILILTLLTAGCTDTGGANPETPKYTAPPEEVPVVEETAAAEPAPEPTETHWYDDRPELNYGILTSDDNLFNQDIDGIINEAAKANGNYNIYNDDSFVIFKHQKWTPSNLRLDLELSPDQYRTLVDQYGDMISVTMETIDLDQDGAMDKVAVKYVGTDGEWTEDFYYDKRANVEDYIIAHISPEIYPSLRIN